MALLTGVAQASSGSGPQGEAVTPGMDFLGALLAAAPVAPADPAVDSLLPAATSTGEAPADNATAAELAALVATLLPVAATDAAPAPAPPSVEATEIMEAGTPVAAATTSAAKALEQLLQRLAQEAGGSGGKNQGEQAPGRSPVPTATSIASASAPTYMTAAATPATPQLPADGLQQLLRAMAPRTATAEPQATMPKPGNSRGAASQAFALPQAAANTADAADAVLQAPEPAIRPAVDAQPAQFTLPATDIQGTAPASAQSSSPSQVQPQAAALAQSPQPQLATPAATHTVHNPVGTPRWADELGSRMMLMTVRGQHEGSLNLTPEHLGPLEVRVSVNQGTANVWFGAQHADTRAALAEALPRLRELFADAGLLLGHAGVSQEAPRQQPRSSEPERLAGPAAAHATDELDGAAPVARRVALGLVDTYA